MFNQHKILRVLQLINLLKARPAKSIRHLARILDSTERTVYRYLDLLEELGFHLEKDDYRRFSIPGDDPEQAFSFSPQETALLRDLVIAAGNTNKLKDSLLKKLYVASDLQIVSNHLLKAHLGKVVEDIGQAIQEKRQVVLKKYHSANSQDTRDRLVEPVRFTDNYQSVSAYEPESGKTKLFNIERITAVEIRKQPFKFEQEHKYAAPDVFGYGETGKRFDIDLSLSMRASLLLREEYPMAASCLKEDKRSETFRFKVTVNSYKPAARFTLGLLDEIEINGPEEFRAYLRTLVDKRLQ